MRLFLSSESLGRHPKRFYELVGDNKKLAFCENAKDSESEADRKMKRIEHFKQFTKEGYEVEELDLRKFFGKKDELEKWLEDFGAVWISGGNTFILRRAMKSSGFDLVVKKRLSEDTIAYGGSSAGSCVAAINLHGIDIGDKPEPEEVPANYPIKEIIWDGLGLIDFMIVPHYDSNWWGDYAKEAAKYLKEHKLRHRVLNDGQVILIDGNREEFLQ